MASQLKTDDPLSCKHGCEWDSQTVRTFVEKESTCAGEITYSFSSIIVARSEVSHWTVAMRWYIVLRLLWCRKFILPLLSRSEKNVFKH